MSHKLYLIIKSIKYILEITEWIITPLSKCKKIRKLHRIIQTQLGLISRLSTFNGSAFSGFNGTGIFSLQFLDLDKVIFEKHYELQTCFIQTTEPFTVVQPGYNTQHIFPNAIEHISLVLNGIWKKLHSPYKPIQSNEFSKNPL